MLLYQYHWWNDENRWFDKKIVKSIKVNRFVDLGGVQIYRIYKFLVTFKEMIF